MTAENKEQILLDIERNKEGYVVAPVTPDEQLAWDNQARDKLGLPRLTPEEYAQRQTLKTETIQPRINRFGRAVNFIKQHIPSRVQ